MLKRKIEKTLLDRKKNPSRINLSDFGGVAGSAGYRGYIKNPRVLRVHSPAADQRASAKQYAYKAIVWLILFGRLPGNGLEARAFF